MLVGEIFLNTFRTERVCWIGGHYGSFKTALALRMGIEFVERGWSKHILTNFPCEVATDLHRLESLDDCFCILDEAGVWMNEGTFRNVIAYPRKINTYLCLASKVEPPLKARKMTVQMVFNFWEWGIPLLRFQCSVDDMNNRERFPLHWWRPSEVFGLWDTKYVVRSGRGLVEVINAAFARLGNDEEVELPEWAKPYKFDKALAGDGDKGQGIPELEDARRVAETAYEAAQKMEQAVSLSRKFRRKAGRR